MIVVFKYVKLNRRSEFTSLHFISYTGIGFSYEGISVPDNSELRSSPINPDQLSILICASSSLSPSVGQWIAPNGMDITQSTTALFEVTVGGIDNPGFLSMQQRSGAAINFSNGTAGVYTCALSDENGIQSRIRVGVYPFDYSNRKQICALIYYH